MLKGTAVIAIPLKRLSATTFAAQGRSICRGTSFSSGAVLSASSLSIREPPEALRRLRY